jgi:single-stranded-DNA-specific exonuclease
MAEREGTERQEARWVLRETDVEAKDCLTGEVGHALLASVLAARGFSPGAEADTFLSPSLASLPDPLLLPGMEAAVDTLARAAEAKETVWVYTDYDVDGVSSAALLSKFFTASGISSQVRLPRRDREGYGLNSQALREIAASGGRTVVTADCGIDAMDEARLARELGISLVITDHHIPGSRLPEAAAVVNPKLPSSRYPDADLAGVGVAWNLAAALRRRLRDNGHFASSGEPDIRRFLDMVALGTVADVAPLLRVNRTLVTYGLSELNRPRPAPGIEALAEASGISGRVRSGHIGFQLGPRLNAAGRMSDPREALELLCTDDSAHARLLAERLNELNRQRRTVEGTTLDEAVARIAAEEWYPARWSLVLESGDWHPGVLGIVASRLAERYIRPALVISAEGDEARGSARSIPGLHIHETLAACAEFLEEFGGHAAAAGFRIRRSRIAPFRERFEEEVRSRITAEAFVPVITLDAETSFGALSLDAVEELEKLEPFGMGNPTPAFLSTGISVIDIHPLGRSGEHLKLQLEQGGKKLAAKAWRQAEALAHLAPGQRIDLAYKPEVNNWKGRKSVELIVKGARSPQSTS